MFKRVRCPFSFTEGLMIFTPVIGGKFEFVVLERGFFQLRSAAISFFETAFSSLSKVQRSSLSHIVQSFSQDSRSFRISHSTRMWSYVQFQSSRATIL